MAIDGAAIFAVYQTYTSKFPKHVKIEGHQKYIDIQFIFDGTEHILLATEKDVVFPKCGDYLWAKLRAGEAAILYPEDLHGLGYCADSLALAKKIVVKVSV